MTSSSTCSRIERRPRAPVLRASALRAIARSAQLADLELDAFHAEHLLVLLDQRVLRLDQDLDQRRLVELVERRHDRQPADELGNQAELDQVLGLGARAAAIVMFLRSSGTRDFGAEADAGLRRALADDLLQPVERAAADEQDVGRVDLDELLVRMLAPALRRNADAIVPSISFSSACCTPSPDTSRVIDGLSLLREILSISSM